MTAIPPPTEPLAVVAATMGILSIPLVPVCLLGTLTGIASIACGLIARGRIHRSELEFGPPARGLGLTVTGIVSGSVAVFAGVVVLAVVAASSPGG